MAKKRVHEIAKERGISSKEVLAVLQAAGLDVKAAASSVDEAEIERAFDAKNVPSRPSLRRRRPPRPRRLPPALSVRCARTVVAGARPAAAAAS